MLFYNLRSFHRIIITRKILSSFGHRANVTVIPISTILRTYYYSTPSMTFMNHSVMNTGMITKRVSLQDNMKRRTPIPKSTVWNLQGNWPEPWSRRLKTRWYCPDATLSFSTCWRISWSSESCNTAGTGRQHRFLTGMRGVSSTCKEVCAFHVDP